MLNSEHSKQRKALRKIQELQLQILRLRQKADRTTGADDAGGLEEYEMGYLSQLEKDLIAEVASNVAWARPLCLRLKPKKVGER